jgi:hypothetical protein
MTCSSDSPDPGLCNLVAQMVGFVHPGCTGAAVSHKQRLSRSGKSNF